MPDSIPTTIRGPRVPGPILGLRDGGHVIPTCSNCNRPLCDVFITMPHAKDRSGQPYQWKIKATCAYGCKRADGSPETSFISEFQGLYHLGGYGVDNPDDPDDSKMLTGVVDVVFEDDVMVIQTKRF